MISAADAIIEITPWEDFRRLEDGPVIICQSLLVLFNDLNIEELFDSELVICQSATVDDSDNSSSGISPSQEALDLLREQFEQVLVPQTLKNSSENNEDDIDIDPGCLLNLDQRDVLLLSNDNNIFVNKTEPVHCEPIYSLNSSGIDFANEGIDTLSDEVFETDKFKNGNSLKGIGSVCSFDSSLSGTSSTHNSYNLSTLGNSCSLDSNQSSDQSDISETSSLHLRQLFKLSGESEVERREEFLSSPDSAQIKFRRNKQNTSYKRLDFSPLDQYINTHLNQQSHAMDIKNQQNHEFQAGQHTDPDFTAQNFSDGDLGNKQSLAIDIRNQQSQDFRIGQSLGPDFGVQESSHIDLKHPDGNLRRQIINHDDLLNQQSLDKYTKSEQNCDYDFSTSQQCIDSEINGQQNYEDFSYQQSPDENLNQQSLDINFRDQQNAGVGISNEKSLNQQSLDVDILNKQSHNADIRNQPTNNAEHSNKQIMDAELKYQCPYDDPPDQQSSDFDLSNQLSHDVDNSSHANLDTELRNYQTHNVEISNKQTPDMNLSSQQILKTEQENKKSFDVNISNQQSQNTDPSYQQSHGILVKHQQSCAYDSLNQQHIDEGLSIQQSSDINANNQQIPDGNFSNEQTPDAELRNQQNPVVGISYQELSYENTQIQQSLYVDLKIQQNSEVGVKDMQHTAADSTDLQNIGLDFTDQTRTDTDRTNQQRTDGDCTIKQSFDVGLTKQQNIHADLMNQQHVGVTGQQSIDVDLTNQQSIGVDLTNQQSVSVDLTNQQSVGVDLTNKQSVGVDLTNKQSVDLDLTNQQSVGVDLTNQQSVGVDLTNQQSVDLDLTLKQCKPKCISFINQENIGQFRNQIDNENGGSTKKSVGPALCSAPAEILKSDLKISRKQTNSENCQTGNEDTEPNKQRKSGNMESGKQEIENLQTENDDREPTKQEIEECKTKKEDIELRKHKAEECQSQIEGRESSTQAIKTYHNEDTEPIKREIEEYQQDNEIREQGTEATEEYLTDNDDTESGKLQIKECQTENEYREPNREEKEECQTETKDTELSEQALKDCQVKKKTVEQGNKNTGNYQTEIDDIETSMQEIEEYQTSNEDTEPIKQDFKKIQAENDDTETSMQETEEYQKNNEDTEPGKHDINECQTESEHRELSTQSIEECEAEKEDTETSKHEKDESQAENENKELSKKQIEEYRAEKDETEECKIENENTKLSKLYIEECHTESADTEPNKQDIEECQTENEDTEPNKQEMEKSLTEIEDREPSRQAIVGYPTENEETVLKKWTDEKCKTQNEATERSKRDKEEYQTENEDIELSNHHIEECQIENTDTELTVQAIEECQRENKDSDSSKHEFEICLTENEDTELFAAEMEECQTGNKASEPNNQAIEGCQAEKDITEQDNQDREDCHTENADKKTNTLEIEECETDIEDNEPSTHEIHECKTENMDTVLNKQTIEDCQIDIVNTEINKYKTEKSLMVNENKDLSKPEIEKWQIEKKESESDRLGVEECQTENEYYNGSKHEVQECQSQNEDTQLSRHAIVECQTHTENEDTELIKQAKGECLTGNEDREPRKLELEVCKMNKIVPELYATKTDKIVAELYTSEKVECQTRKEATKPSNQERKDWQTENGDKKLDIEECQTKNEDTQPKRKEIEKCRSQNEDTESKTLEIEGSQTDIDDREQCFIEHKNTLLIKQQLEKCQTENISTDISKNQIDESQTGNENIERSKHENEECKTVDTDWETNRFDIEECQVQNENIELSRQKLEECQMQTENEKAGLIKQAIEECQTENEDREPRKQELEVCQIENDDTQPCTQEIEECKTVNEAKEPHKQPIEECQTDKEKIEQNNQETKCYQKKNEDAEPNRQKLELHQADNENTVLSKHALVECQTRNEYTEPSRHNLEESFSHNEDTESNTLEIEECQTDIQDQQPSTQTIEEWLCENENTLLNKQPIEKCQTEKLNTDVSKHEIENNQAGNENKELTKPEIEECQTEKLERELTRLAIEERHAHIENIVQSRQELEECQMQTENEDTEHIKQVIEECQMENEEREHRKQELEVCQIENEYTQPCTQEIEECQTRNEATEPSKQTLEDCQTEKEETKQGNQETEDYHKETEVTEPSRQELEKCQVGNENTKLRKHAIEECQTANKDTDISTREIESPTQHEAQTKEHCRTQDESTETVKQEIEEWKTEKEDRKPKTLSIEERQTENETEQDNKDTEEFLTENEDSELSKQEIEGCQAKNEDTESSRQEMEKCQTENEDTEQGLHPMEECQTENEDSDLSTQVINAFQTENDTELSEHVIQEYHADNEDADLNQPVIKEPQTENKDTEPSRQVIEEYKTEGKDIDQSAQEFKGSRVQSGNRETITQPFYEDTKLIKQEKREYETQNEYRKPNQQGIEECKIDDKEQNAQAVQEWQTQTEEEAQSTQAINEFLIHNEDTEPIHQDIDEFQAENADIEPSKKGKEECQLLSEYSELINQERKECHRENEYVETSKHAIEKCQTQNESIEQSKQETNERHIKNEYLETGRHEIKEWQIQNVETKQNMFECQTRNTDIEMSIDESIVCQTKNGDAETKSLEKNYQTNNKYIKASTRNITECQTNDEDIEASRHEIVKCFTENEDKESNITQIEEHQTKNESIEAYISEASLIDEGDYVDVCVEEDICFEIITRLTNTDKKEKVSENSKNVTLENSTNGVQWHTEGDNEDNLSEEFKVIVAVPDNKNMAELSAREDKCVELHTELCVELHTEGPNLSIEVNSGHSISSQIIDECSNKTQCNQSPINLVEENSDVPLENSQLLQEPVAATSFGGDDLDDCLHLNCLFESCSLEYISDDESDNCSQKYKSDDVKKDITAQDSGKLKDVLETSFISNRNRLKSIEEENETDIECTYVKEYTNLIQEGMTAVDLSLQTILEETSTEDDLFDEESLKRDVTSQLIHIKEMDGTAEHMLEKMELSTKNVETEAIDETIMSCESKFTEEYDKSEYSDLLQESIDMKLPNTEAEIGILHRELSVHADTLILEPTLNTSVLEEVTENANYIGSDKENNTFLSDKTCFISVVDQKNENKENDHHTNSKSNGLEAIISEMKTDLRTDKEGNDIGSSAKEPQSDVEDNLNDDNHVSCENKDWLESEETITKDTTDILLDCTYTAEENEEILERSETEKTGTEFSNLLFETGVTDTIVKCATQSENTEIDIYMNQEEKSSEQCGVPISQEHHGNAVMQSCVMENESKNETQGNKEIIDYKMDAPAELASNKLQVAASKEVNETTIETENNSVFSDSCEKFTVCSEMIHTDIELETSAIGSKDENKGEHDKTSLDTKESDADKFKEQRTVDTARLSPPTDLNESDTSEHAQNTKVFPTDKAQSDIEDKESASYVCRKAQNHLEVGSIQSEQNNKLKQPISELERCKKENVANGSHEVEEKHKNSLADKTNEHEPYMVDDKDTSISNSDNNKDEQKEDSTVSYRISHVYSENFNKGLQTMAEKLVSQILAKVANETSVKSENKGLDSNEEQISTDTLHEVSNCDSDEEYDISKEMDHPEMSTVVDDELYEQDGVNLFAAKNETDGIEIIESSKEPDQENMLNASSESPGQNLNYYSEKNLIGKREVGIELNNEEDTGVIKKCVEEPRTNMLQYEFNEKLYEVSKSEKEWNAEGSQYIVNKDMEIGHDSKSSTQIGETSDFERGNRDIKNSVKTHFNEPILMYNASGDTEQGAQNDDLKVTSDLSAQMSHTDDKADMIETTDPNLYDAHSDDNEILLSEDVVVKQEQTQEMNLTVALVSGSETSEKNQPAVANEQTVDFEQRDEQTSKLSCQDHIERNDTVDIASQRAIVGDDVEGKIPEIDDQEDEVEEFPLSVLDDGPGFNEAMFGSLDAQFTKPKRLSIINEETDTDFNDTNLEESNLEDNAFQNSSFESNKEIDVGSQIDLGSNHKINRMEMNISTESCKVVKKDASMDDSGKTDNSQRTHGRSLSYDNKIKTSIAFETEPYGMNRGEHAKKHVKIHENLTNAYQDLTQCTSSEDKISEESVHVQTYDDHEFDDFVGKCPIDNLVKQGNNMTEQNKIFLKTSVGYESEISGDSECFKSNAETPSESGADSVLSEKPAYSEDIEEVLKYSDKTDDDLFENFASKYDLIRCEKEMRSEISEEKAGLIEEKGVKLKDSIQTYKSADEEDIGLTTRKELHRKQKILEDGGTKTPEVGHTMSDKIENVEITNNEELCQAECNIESQDKSKDKTVRLDNEACKHDSAESIATSEKPRPVAEINKTLSRAESINRMFKSNLTADLSRRVEYNKGWRVHSTGNGSFITSCHGDSSNSNNGRHGDSSNSNNGHQDIVTSRHENTQKRQAKGSISSESQTSIDRIHENNEPKAINKLDKKHIVGTSEGIEQVKKGDYIFDHDSSCMINPSGIDYRHGYKMMTKENKRSAFQHASMSNTTVQDCSPVTQTEISQSEYKDYPCDLKPSRFNQSSDNSLTNEDVWQLRDEAGKIEHSEHLPGCKRQPYNHEKHSSSDIKSRTSQGYGKRSKSYPEKSASYKGQLFFNKSQEYRKPSSGQHHQQVTDDHRQPEKLLQYYEKSQVNPKYTHSYIDKKCDDEFSQVYRKQSHDYEGQLSQSYSEPSQSYSGMLQSGDKYLLRQGSERGQFLKKQYKSLPREEQDNSDYSDSDYRQRSRIQRSESLQDKHIPTGSMRNSLQRSYSHSDTSKHKNVRYDEEPREYSQYKTKSSHAQIADSMSDRDIAREDINYKKQRSDSMSDRDYDREARYIKQHEANYSLTREDMSYKKQRLASLSERDTDRECVNYIKQRSGSMSDRDIEGEDMNDRKQRSDSMSDRNIDTESVNYRKNRPDSMLDRGMDRECVNYTKGRSDSISDTDIDGEGVNYRQQRSDSMSDRDMDMQGVNYRKQRIHSISDRDMDIQGENYRKHRSDSMPYRDMDMQGVNYRKQRSDSISDRDMNMQGENHIKQRSDSMSDRDMDMQVENYRKHRSDSISDKDIDMEGENYNKHILHSMSDRNMAREDIHYNKQRSDSMSDRDVDIEAVNYRQQRSDSMSDRDMDRDDINERKNRSDSLSDRYVAREVVNYKKQRSDSLSDRDISREGVNYKKQRSYSMSDRDIVREDIHYKKQRSDSMSDRDMGMEGLNYRQQRSDSMSDRDIVRDDIHYKKQRSDSLSDRDISRESVNYRQQRSDSLSDRDISREGVNYKKHRSDSISDRDIGMEGLNYRQQRSDSMSERDIIREDIHYKKQRSDSLSDRDISRESVNYRQQRSDSLSDRDISREGVNYKKHRSDSMSDRDIVREDIHYKKQRSDSISDRDMGTEGLNYRQQRSDSMSDRDIVREDIHYEKQISDSLSDRDISRESVNYRQQRSDSMSDREMGMEGLNYRQQISDSMSDRGIAREDIHYKKQRSDSMSDRDIVREDINYRKQRSDSELTPDNESYRVRPLGQHKSDKFADSRRGLTRHEGNSDYVGQQAWRTVTGDGSGFSPHSHQSDRYRHTQGCTETGPRLIHRSRYEAKVQSYSPEGSTKDRNIYLSAQDSNLIDSRSSRVHTDDQKMREHYPKYSKSVKEKHKKSSTDIGRKHNMPSVDLSPSRDGIMRPREEQINQEQKMLSVDFSPSRGGIMRTREEQINHKQNQQTENLNCHPSQVTYSDNREVKYYGKPVSENSYSRRKRNQVKINQYSHDMKTEAGKDVSLCDPQFTTPKWNHSNGVACGRKDSSVNIHPYKRHVEGGDGIFQDRYKTGDRNMRIKQSEEDKAKDGPLSLTDAYGSMENHNNNHTSGHALSQSTNHLSGSVTSLSNRHAPAASPSRQGTLTKQQSLQSNTSEMNGGHSVDEGVKFERLKNLSEDDLMGKIKEIIGHFEKLEDFHRGDGMRIQKMLGDMYWDYTHMREMIGDCMADSGYAALAMNMLKTLNGIGIFKNDDVWFPTYYTYNTMWNFTDASNQLAKALSEHDAVRLLTLNCGHKPYINALHSKNVYYVIKASLSILHNIARNSGMKHLFDENKTSETIMPFLESEDEMLKILATLTISNIVDEEENKALITETGTIHCIVSWLEKALSLPRRRYKGFTPQELTEGLNKLAVNDSNKFKIVEEGALPLFLKMLQHDDVREQSSAARVIWTLSFDKDVRDKIKEIQELMAQLEKLSESTNKSLQMNTTGALWVIKGENEVSKENEDEPVPKNKYVFREKTRLKGVKSARTKTHVFLSYSWSDKETVLQIRDRLRAEGYALWIDIEKMGGSTLEAMSSAVENAAVVLVCMSEKYKQSPNCRTEAEYTFQLKKDYIPIMMQKKYRPDGWLGIILGAKLYFDFSGKYPFEKSFQGLLKELRGRGKVTPEQTPGDHNDHTDAAIVHSTSISSHASYGTPVHPVPSNSVIHTMGQEELIKWLRNIKLTDCIPAFMEFDGRLLMQLKVMRSEAPEFFYQCLEKRLNMSLIEILKFTRALEELH